jgi:hypothetical protein
LCNFLNEKLDIDRHEILTRAIERIWFWTKFTSPILLSDIFSKIFTCRDFDRKGKWNTKMMDSNYLLEINDFSFLWTKVCRVVIPLNFEYWSCANMSKDSNSRAWYQEIRSWNRSANHLTSFSAVVKLNFCTFIKILRFFRCQHFGLTVCQNEMIYCWIRWAILFDIRRFAGYHWGTRDVDADKHILERNNFEVNSLISTIVKFRSGLAMHTSFVNVMRSHLLRSDFWIKNTFICFDICPILRKSMKFGACSFSKAHLVTSNIF